MLDSHERAPGWSGPGLGIKNDSFGAMTGGDMLEKALELGSRRLHRRDFWPELLTHSTPREVAEVGVWKGEFAALLLHKVPSIERYLAIDPYQHLPNWNKPFNVSDHDFEKVLHDAKTRLEPYSPRVEFVRKSFAQAETEIRNQSLDFIYVDSDHTLRGIAIDLDVAGNKVKPGAVIGGDDLTKTVWPHGTRYSPSFVFPYVLYWAEIRSFPVITLPARQWLVIADASLGFSWSDFDGYKSVTERELYRKRPTRLSWKSLMKKMATRRDQQEL